MRIAYVNGRYVPHQQAMVAMEDRGYQFADGLYEVAIFYNKRFLDWELHRQRLHYSCEQLRIPLPMSDRALKSVADYLVDRNAYPDGFIYMQVTRGVAKRNHMFPAKPPRPFLTMSVMPVRKPDESQLMNGVRVITTEDIRWKRCDIKSIALLPNVLVLQEAQEAGAYEAFMFNEQDHLTECGRSTAFIIKDNTVVTHPQNRYVLPGIRKKVVQQLCQDHDIAYVERSISRDEVMQADEAFLTSATNGIMPVTQIDDIILGNGRAGVLSQRLIKLYDHHVLAQTEKQ